MAHRRIPLLLGWLMGLLLLAGCGAAAGAEEPPAHTKAAPTSTPALHNTHTTTATITLPPVDPADVTGNIISAGSSTVFPLAQRIAEEFEAEGYTGRHLIDSIGSGAGFERFCVAGETDISNAHRPIRDYERASCLDIGRDPLAFRLGSAPLAVAVSTDNDFVQDVTLAELAEIFSTAETWQDVRPEWPPELILRYSPGTDSYAFAYFVDEVFDENPEPLLNASNLQMSENNNVLVQGIEASPFSVGYFDYAYADQQRDRLRLLVLDGTAPTSQTIESETYPLMRSLYLYSDAGIMQRKPQVAAFLNYALTNLNDLIGDVGYTHATTATLNQAKQTWLIAMGLIQLDERVYLPLVQRGGDTISRGTITMGRAAWDTGWFQAAIYRQLLQELGYDVSEPATLSNPAFYLAAARGDVDFWANGWFPLHTTFLQDEDVVGKLEPVGSQVEAGGMQGYMVDKATADALGITRLDDLKDPDIAAVFDSDNDGLADLIGCNPGWNCELVIEHHLNAYDLRETVQHVQREYSELMADTISRYESGEPILFYTWTPNWTIGALQPGEDVVWIEVPFSSLPLDQQDMEAYTTRADVPGCVANPCNLGFPVNNIRIVANRSFLDANPVARRLFELVEIPLQDIAAQNLLLQQGEDSADDIQRHASAWIADHRTQVNAWLAAAQEAASISDTPMAQATPSPTPTPTPTPSPTPTATRPTDAFLRDAAFIDEQCGWLVHGVGNDAGERIGTELLATCDSGQTWTTRYTTTASLGEIDFISQQQGWMVISDTLHTTTDSGHTWQPFATHVLTRVARVDFVDAQHGWVRSATRYPNHGLLRTTDGGQTWQELDEPCSSFWRPGMASFVSPTDGWLLCGSTPGAGHQLKILYRTTDGGQSWQQIPRNADPPDPAAGDLPFGGYLQGFFFLDDEHGWMSSGRFPYGSIYRTTDSGQTWDYIDSGVGSDGTKGRLHFTSPTHGTMLMRVDIDDDAPQGMQMRYVLVRTTDGGQTWEQIYP